MIKKKKRHLLSRTVFPRILKPLSASWPASYLISLASDRSFHLEAQEVVVVTVVTKTGHLCLRVTHSGSDTK